MAHAAWRAEFERGRAAGAADRAAGRKPADWTDAERDAAGSLAFWRGYPLGHEPDAPVQFPVPLGLALSGAAVSAALDAWSRRGGWMWRLAVMAPTVYVLSRLDVAAGRRRARRAGVTHRADAPPVPVDGSWIVQRVGMNTARAWDAKRRGVWPPSAWTTFGWLVPSVVRNELRWRRWAASWDRAAPPP